MILHLGGDVAAAEKELIMIMDAQTAGHARVTRQYVAQMGQQGCLESLAEGEAKSYVLACPKGGKAKLYASPISSVTLARRVAEGADL